MTIFDFFTLLGGLALFLFGMSVMSTGLENCAGNKLKNILASLTSSPFRGFLLGLGVTAVMQSSSATTVMVVGFVNSGIMELQQAVGVIMGANLGTSVTSWLLSLTGIEGEALWLQLLKPSNFSPLLAFIGILLYMFSKSHKKKDVGSILIGFAVLMFGMDFMSGAVEPLAESEAFRNTLTLFSNPLIGVLVGAVFTATIQSSSASVGILQALSLTGSVSFATAIPIIMGQNIGTCVSALISSIGANKNAKRAAVIHICFNTIGTMIILPIFYLIDWFVNFSFLDTAVDPLWIAVLHTVFNILSIIILMPFTTQLEKLSRLLVNDSKKDMHNQLLDERLLATPSVAVERCRAVAVEMADISIDSLLRATALLNNFSEKEASAVRILEDQVDKYEDTLGTYLVKLSSQRMSEEDSAEASKLLHIIGDFERISDHAVNIVESAEEIQDKKLVLSPEAQKELSVIVGAVQEILGMALEAFRSGDVEKALMIEPLEDVIDYLKETLKKQHISRLQRSECTIEMGFVLSDLLVNLERVADHCSNIGCCVIEMEHESLDVHDYLNKLKVNPDSEFTRGYDYYRMKYSLS